MKKSKNYNYSLIFQQEPEGGFTVKVPALQGCISYGETLEEAKKMAEKAIRAYIFSLQKHKEIIPTEKNVFIATLSVSIPESKKKVHV
jgi:antitoxin HicB